MRKLAWELAAAVWPALAWGAATLANLLPRRLFRSWEGQLPMGRAAIPSALLTVFLGFGLGVPGFFSYAIRAASVSNDAMLEAAGRELAGKLPGGTVTTAGPVTVSMLSLFAFAFFTPLGLLSTYLVTSGLLRLAAACADEPRGDFVLSALDHGARALAGHVRRNRLADLRERLEGPEVPDVCLQGQAGERADYLIIASRRKPGWEKGVVVVTSDAWYRLGEPYERHYPGGLRTVYPLTEMAKAEVLRRSVYYALPPAREVDPGSTG